LGVAIKVGSEKRKIAVRSIKHYFSEEMGEEIGDLKAQLLLDFVLREIGPMIYNQAISDAQAYFQEKTADLELNCWEVEPDYRRRTDS
jgi:uncharacterized protein (DUF2164 family)